MRVRARIFEMFYAEVVGVMSIWVKEGMKIEAVEGVAKELAHLTETADKRWASAMEQW